MCILRVSMHVALPIGTRCHSCTLGHDDVGSEGGGGGGGGGAPGF